MIGNLIISAAHASEHGGPTHGDVSFYMDAHFWAAMGFFAVVLIILKFGYAKICAALDGRGLAIRDRLESARRVREEAQALLAEYQRKQRDALQESQDILSRARNETKKLKVQTAKDLEERIATAERQAMERIAAAEEQAKHEVRNAAIDVAVTAATKVMEDKLSAAQANALIDRAITELPQKFH